MWYFSRHVNLNLSEMQQKKIQDQNQLLELAMKQETMPFQRSDTYVHDQNSHSQFGFDHGRNRTAKT